MDDLDGEDLHRLHRLETFYKQRFKTLSSRRALLVAWAGLFITCTSLLVAAVAYSDVRMVAGASFAVGAVLFVDSMIVAWHRP